jgi:hypothetical protein
MPRQIKPRGSPSPDVLSEGQHSTQPGRRSAPHIAATSIYGLTIFISAFLLFQVQPLIAKIILPWFGGVAAVWMVCLLFFQTVLLLGYLYAHLLVRMFRSRAQGRIHILLLAAALLTLPILPKDSWKPAGPGDPSLHILALLAACVGLPYLLLSSTSPLLQAWYAQSRPGSSPYRFYSLSNVGSMLALLTYPVLFEPLLSNRHQAYGWSLAYGAVAVLCAFVALSFHGSAPEVASVASGAQPDRQTQTMWVALAACGSALLLAVTNHISQNIAAVPFLWVVPLSIYLLSFIVCFSGGPWYNRDVFLRLLAVALGGMTYALSPEFINLPFVVLISIFCAGLFVCCMVCQGELARLKPDPSHLTSFYLMISLGGVLGAVFVALVAPHVFSGYFEMEVALGACAILVLVALYRAPDSGFFRGRPWPAWVVLVTLTAALIAGLAWDARSQATSARLMVRNFYGVLRVVDETESDFDEDTTHGTEPIPGDLCYHKLMNGTIDHGLEFDAAALRDQPTSYYGPHSGAGLAIEALEKEGPLNVGIIGLGTGTLAAYGRPGDRYTFYEINPLDAALAQTQFSYLKDCRAKVQVVMGDARLSLEREKPQGFDLLAVDAFSGDSIPVHLLTLEAFRLYFRHLKSTGVLAVHISNKYLNLIPVVQAASNRLGKRCLLVQSPADDQKGIYRALWALVGNDEGDLRQIDIVKNDTLLSPKNRTTLWTDDYSTVLPLLK